MKKPCDDNHDDLVFRYPNYPLGRIGAPRRLSLNTPRDLEMTRVDLGEVVAFRGQG
jgi:hypothetical protein